jgi:hypothetical protein
MIASNLNFVGRGDNTEFHVGEKVVVCVGNFIEIVFFVI